MSARPSKNFGDSVLRVCSWVLEFRRPSLEMRFVAVWFALSLLVIADALLLPRAIAASTLLSILPFAAFLAVAAAGQTLVIMSRGIDLSAPATIGAASTTLLAIAGPNNEQLWIALIAAMAISIIIGAVNGFFVVLCKLNSLIVTLAVGSVVTGINLYYRDNGSISSMVSPKLAEFSSQWILGVPMTAAVAIAIVGFSTIILRKSQVGREFELIGANPVAARIAGLRVRQYQLGAFIIAGVFYGATAILLSGFIRNPTIDVGNPYLLAPIAAAVLGGTAMKGGVGSLIAVGGAALFLIQLDQSLKMAGFSTAWQMIIQGVAIAIGMYMSERSTLRRK
ncbi:Ribose transport system permease protein RbsC [compost metagenome]